MTRHARGARPLRRSGEQAMTPAGPNLRIEAPRLRDSRDESLPCVATDRCAFATDQKPTGVGDFSKIPNGTGGLQDLLPVLWAQGVNTGRLTPCEFVAVASTNITRILNMYPRKGAVLVGADADLAVWEPEKEGVVTAATQESRIDYNVFQGQKPKGRPRYTLSRGRAAFEEGKGRPAPGRGQFTPRAPRPAVNRTLSAWKELSARRPVSRSGIRASGV
ncbi:hypothetical protein EP867_05080 [Falsigemmobacter intermedius]|uniref:Amidohydrolase-related domain-containing protein n=1 Tax=Falsigemmobacter intermedius TaxID=1553448 RepID=A0A3S3V0A3_9RHOB|nr:hypothetical protein EP867_05080 [Falsigemmobacter intermedius]